LKNYLVRRELIFIGTLFVLPLATAEQKEHQEEYSFIDKWGSEGDDDGKITKPEDIAVEAKTGNVYITDTGNSRVQVFGIYN
jgi:hypothetical protein